MAWGGPIAAFERIIIGYEKRWSSFLSYDPLGELERS